MGNSANFIAIKVKASQYAAKFIAKEGIMLLLKRLSVNIGSKEILKYIPFVEQIAAAGIGYKMADSFALQILKQKHDIYFSWQKLVAEKQKEKLILIKKSEYVYIRTNQNST